MATTWSLTVTQLDNSRVPAADSSNARVVIDGDTITFFIPENELPGDSPRWRGTAFGHDGTYNPADRGGDVTGANPQEPLLPLILSR